MATPLLGTGSSGSPEPGNCRGRLQRQCHHWEGGQAVNGNATHYRFNGNAAILSGLYQNDCPWQDAAEFASDDLSTLPPPRRMPGPDAKAGPPVGAGRSERKRPFNAYRSIARRPSTPPVAATVQ